MSRKPAVARALEWINRKVGYLSIGAKLLIAFSLLAGVPMAVSGWIGGEVAARGLTSVTHRRLAAEVETLRVGLQTALRAVQTDVAVLASLPEIEAATLGESAAASDHVELDWTAFLEQKPDFHRLRLLNAWGEEVVRIERDRQVDPSELSSQPFYLYRVADADPGGAVITPIELSEGDQTIEAAVSFAQPVWDDNDQLVAVVVAEVLIGKMFAALDTGVEEPGALVLIVDRAGHYVYHSGYAGNWNSLLAERSRTGIGDLYPAEFVDRVLSGEVGSTTLADGDTLAYRPILADHQGFHVLVKTIPGHAIAEPVRNLRRLLMVIMAASLTIALGLAGVAAVHFDQPIGRLMDGARRFAAGEYGHRVDVGSFDEIDDIATTLNAMADEVERREQRIRDHAEHLEELVQERTGELIRAERQAATGQLVAGIAHEIGTPLNVISGTAENLIDDLPDELPDGHPDSMAREDLEIIVSETSRIAQLVRDLQDFARPRPTRREKINVADLAAETLRLLVGPARRSGVTLELRSAGKPADAWIDPMEIKQALLNLLVNAIHASFVGATVGVVVDIDAQCVLVEVRDQGAGIAPEALSRAFEPFYTTKRSSKGTGLGLSIVRRIVERNQGRIEIRSAVGRGTVARLWLPSRRGSVV